MIKPPASFFTSRGKHVRVIVFLTVLLLLLVSFSSTVRGAATSSTVPVHVLQQEISRLLERTIPAFAADRPNQRIRELSDYQRNLRNLRSILEDEKSSAEDVSDAFEEVLQSYSSVAGEVRERRVDKLDEIVEDLEDQRDRFEETEIVPRPRWLSTYNIRFVSETTLERHHAVLVRALGLWAASTLSSDTSYRLEAYLDSMEQVFPKVALELLESSGSPLHNLRYYNSLLTLTEEALGGRTKPSNLEDRYLNQLRRQGDLVLRISRTRAQRAAVEDLIERVDTILRNRSGREAGLLDRNRNP